MTKVDADLYDLHKVVSKSPDSGRFGQKGVSLDGRK